MADVDAGFEGVIAGGVGYGLPALEEIAVSLHDGAGGGIEVLRTVHR